MTQTELKTDSSVLDALEAKYGYRVIRTENLKLIDAVYYELEHVKTGAMHIHIETRDKENTFGVAFKTVPRDSTGVAHILEHTALCGSKKFPVRDPFFSMIKRSLNTFMNAFTASDWTMYPFSSENRKDFYNLMDVYLDAAFFPRLDPLNFKQEGHRIEIADGNENDKASLRLEYKGVVYNEMKGVMSSPDQVMIRSLFKALYPDTTYSHNSGGEPADIPTLTHEQLLDFHRIHYHPSNAFFYTYGNLPLEDHLAFITDRVLSRFTRIDPKTEVPSQPRWAEPRNVIFHYPLDRNEKPEKKYQACVSWLTADITDAYEVLILTLLEQVLIGNPASPLRKALIDSGLGSALCDGTGLIADHKDTMFTVGLKDVEENALEQVEKIVFEVLRELVATGVDRELVDSAIHQLEFHRKEVTNTPYPYGIKLLISFSGPWIHGGDPVRILNFDEDLTRLKKDLTSVPVFENAIESYFIDNPHRVLFKLIPDQSMAEKEEMRVQAELERVKMALTPQQIDQIQKDAQALKALQESGEDLSCLPVLSVDDIPPEIRTIKASDIKNDSIFLYDQPTSGIFYFSCAAGIRSLSDDLIPLVPFFCYAFSKIGTRRRDYTKMARLIDRYTGGIGLSANARTSFESSGGANRDSCVPYVSFSAKCLDQNLQNMFDIIREMTTEFDFTDTRRIKTLLLEYRAARESMTIRSGHQMAVLMASRYFSTSRFLKETWSGIHQLKTIKALSDRLDPPDLEDLSRKLAAIGSVLFSKGNVRLALVGQTKPMDDAMACTNQLLNTLKIPTDSELATDVFTAPGIEIDDVVPFEGWSTSTAVSFVASAFKTVRTRHEDAPALSVISKLLRHLFIHGEIREKGGAYGGYASYSGEDGLFSFSSYRDPHIVETLNVFQKAFEFIRSGKYTDEDVKDAIIQICSEIDKPDPPGPSARKSFYRHLIHLSDEDRARFKQGILDTTRDRVLAAADKYFDTQKIQQAIAVVSSEEKLKKANASMTLTPLAIHRI